MKTVYKKTGRPTKAALKLRASIISARLGDGEEPIRLHLVGYYGRGRNTTPAYGEHRAALEILDECGISYTVGNDAPRGGAGGTYIELSQGGARDYLARVQE